MKILPQSNRRFGQGLCVALAVVASTWSIRAEVVDVSNSKEKYYEIHRETAGYHWFYIIPSEKSAGGATANVEGWKDGKLVFCVHSMTNTSSMPWAVRSGKLESEELKAFSFAAKTEDLDKLILTWSVPRQGNLPGGISGKTDLLWLLGEAKKDGRFREHSKKPNDSKKPE